MPIKNNMVGWFEIPVHDMERAIKFYETVFAVKLERQKLDSLDMAWFPWIETGHGSSGSLVHAPDFFQPSRQGILVYFTAHSGDVNIELSRMEKAGGKILQKKTLITPEIGYMAVLMDTEGNRIALHARE